MIDEDLLIKFLDAVSDDAYEISEIWNITRGPGVSEHDARTRTREALVELQRRGYVHFVREHEPGKYHDLTQVEFDAVRDDPTQWGIKTDQAPTLAVTTTVAGDLVLKRSRR
jgi:hypothetical protein